MKILPTAARPLAEALGLGPTLLAHTESDGEPWIAASLVEGPAVVLGAAQRAGRVVRLDACAAAHTKVLRRATAGTAVYVGARAIVWTLALPHVAALVRDATPRTLLNRNVRGFLAGLSRAGAIAHYFGREWISVRKRPAAVLGFDMTPRGAVLMEVFANLDVPPAVPEALAADEERAIDRWLGKQPAALGELIAEDPAVIAREVARTVALRAAVSMKEVAAPAGAPAREIGGADDPLPAGFEKGPLRRAPIGWIDTAVDRAGGRAWIGGDVLAPRWVLDAIAEGRVDIGEVPVDGATVADLREAGAAARG